MAFLAPAGARTAGAERAAQAVGRRAEQASAAAGRSLTLGISDGAFLGKDGAGWIGRAAAAGAQWVRVDIGWVAPDTATEPPGFDPQNPADPRYDFTAADAAMRAAAADGLKVLLTFTGAPPWAEGPNRPASALAGTWRPSPQAVADYGIALARRYSGRFPDPLEPGRNLPRVTAFQPWNEPNLTQYLSPQWSGNQPESPTMYRSMLNAFYAAVKSVDPSAIVVTAGTAPFGDPFTGGQRIPPALFWRKLLCLREAGSALRGAPCPDPAHFDVLAHHPYSIYGPSVPALDPDDISVADIGKLTRILRAAERTGRALPRIHHPIWVTEVGYNTKPPNPTGVPVAKDARWLDQALELLWHEGVGTIFWNTIVDQPPDPTYQNSSQAGLFYVDGRPKPALAAFGFPLFVARGQGAGVEVWGRAPAAGRLAIQQRRGSSWITVRTFDVATGTTFEAQLDARGSVTVRARVGGRASPPWRLG